MLKIILNRLKPQTEIIAEEQADALEDHKGTVSIGGRTVTDLHFAADIDGLQERKKN